MKTTIKISLISVALISSLQAQNQYTLQTINVTSAQGTTLNKKDVTDSVTIITKEQLEESRVTTLPEALNKLGGISMTQNGGAGSSSSMFLRGMSAKRVLVLVDGVRYNDPAAIGAAASLSHIMLNNVEQIEIIKGAQSGVWGSDASGGVINIITSKSKKGLSASLKTEYGSFNTVNTSLVASYGADKYDVTLGALSYTTDGFSAREKEKGDVDYGKRYDELGYEKDSYINETFDAKLGYNFTKDDRVEFKVQSIDTFLKYDSSTGDRTDKEAQSYSRFYNLSYSHKDTLNDVKLNLNSSKFYREFGSSKYTGSVDEIKLDDKISYAKNSFLRVGASAQKFKQEEITANTDKEYNAISAFATNYNKFELFSEKNTILTESLRYDSYDNFDDSLTGKVGAKQFFNKEYYLSANVGTGYNAPTLGQLYGQWGPNPDLKPETSLTSDITLGSDRLWVTGFHNQITDLIEYISGNYTQTTGISTFTGLEVGYEDYFFDKLGIKAMYTYLQAKNANKQTLARRPESQVDASMTYYSNDNYDIGVNAQYIGTRYDEDDNKGAQTGDYVVSNLISNFKVNKNVSIYGKINNLTDVYYQTVDGYATAGRSLYIGLNAKY